MSACEQYGHAWYTRTFGGIGCGRCGQERSAFCMIDGRPVPHDAAKAVIDVLGLEVETRVTTYPAPGSEQFEDATVTYDDVSDTFVAVMDGLDISDRYNDWFDSLPCRSRLIGRIEE